MYTICMLLFMLINILDQRRGIGELYMVYGNYIWYQYNREKKIFLNLCYQRWMLYLFIF